MSADQRLTDEQVAWYAGTSRTAKWTADMAVHENIVTLAREVQERRAAEVKWEAIRQTVNCPTCGGDMKRHFPPAYPGGPPRATALNHCPDCTEDGKIGMARLLAVGAAVFTEPRGTTAEYRQGHNQLLDRLRQVRP